MNSITKFKHLVSTSKQIVEILTPLDYKTWHKFEATEESLKSFSKIMGALTTPVGEVCEEEDDELDTASLLELLNQEIEMCTTCLGIEELKKIKTAVVEVERDSKIADILDGTVTPKRLSPKLKIKLTCIILWLQFNYMRYSFNMMISGKELHDSSVQDWVSSFGVGANDMKSQEFCNLMDNDLGFLKKAQTFAEIQLSDKSNLDIQQCDRITNRLESLFDFYQYKATFENSRLNLYILINNMFIPLRMRKQIIEVIQKSIFRKIVQQDYDLRRSYMPALTSVQFYDSGKIEVNSILPSDFDKGERGKGEGMMIKLSHCEVVSLYHELSGKFIDNETDICDFAYALTGYPFKQKDHFKKIIWIDKHKQTLGIFLGMLRSYSTADERSWYWNAAPKYFAYNNRTTTLKPSELSSPFGNFQKHPEIQGADWENMNNIVQKCLKACDK